MKRSQMLWIIVLPLCFIDSLCWAATAYVTDSFEITLRTGPSGGNKIMATLRSGQSLEILETREDRTLVRIVNSGGEQKKGWVLSRYLVRREPWETQARVLLKQNASLREKLTSLEKRWEESSQREGELNRELQRTSHTLRTVQGDFESLKTESSEFLRLKENYETTKSTLQEMEDRFRKLTEGNEALKSSQYVSWFLAGALVFFRRSHDRLGIWTQRKEAASGTECLEGVTVSIIPSTVKSSELVLGIRIVSVVLDCCPLR